MYDQPFLGIQLQVEYKEISQQLGKIKSRFLFVVEMGRLRVCWCSDENNSIENKQLMMKEKGKNYWSVILEQEIRRFHAQVEGLDLDGHTESSSMKQEVYWLLICACFRAMKTVTHIIQQIKFT